ncbi:MAG TPA: hypothetical protein VK968_13625 [Roseimicrobium sp.]|nr:hypothetical protein [Roseimicrobium sp.]
MNTSIPHPQRSNPVGLIAVVWLSIFLSPSVYFFLLIVANRFQIHLPETIVWGLFSLIPVVALLVCESMVWSRSRTVGRKIGWMLFTLVAMLLQFGILLAILQMILVAAIGYAQ